MHGHPRAVLDTLKTCQHHPLEPAAAISAYLHRLRAGKIELCGSQQRLLAAFRAREPIYDLNRDSTCSGRERLKAYTLLFDNLLFRGLLTKPSNLDVILLYRSVGISSGDTQRIDGRTTIEVYIHHEHIYNPQKRFRKHIGVLLHEMTHAFLLGYGCQECIILHENMGTTGHGHAWQDLMHAIQPTTKDFLGLDVLANRLGHLAIELKLANGEESDALLKNAGTRWGFTSEEVKIAVEFSPPFPVALPSDPPWATWADLFFWDDYD